MVEVGEAGVLVVGEEEGAVVEEEVVAGEAEVKQLKMIFDTC